MTTTYLLCHGPLASNNHPWFPDEIDALARTLRGRGIGAIHCSDSPCCRQTAAFIARELRVLVTEHHELREIAIGDESVPGCIRRILPTWQSIASAGHTAIVVIAHAGLNRILLGHLLKLPIDEMLRLDQDDGRINIIECNYGRPWVRLLNGNPSELAVELA